MTTPRILAVVLHYGDTALTKAVHAALAHKSAPHEMLVLDNAAPQKYPNAVLLPQNIFWGGALEYALGLARGRKAGYLWFCNNDITFVQPPVSISSARGLSATSGIATISGTAGTSGTALLPFVAGRLAYIAKQCSRPVGVWAPALTSSPYHPHIRHAPGADYRRAHYVDGVAFALNVACVDAIGGLDVGDNLRGYGVDIWLSLRAYKAGWPVIVDQQVVIRHRHHSTARQIEGFMEAAARDENAYMTARLGPDWREIVRSHANVWEE